MIVNASMDTDNFDETVHALKYAAMAATVTASRTRAQTQKAAASAYGMDGRKIRPSDGAKEVEPKKRRKANGKDFKLKGGGRIKTSEASVKKAKVKSDYLEEPNGDDVGSLLRSSTAKFAQGNLSGTVPTPRSGSPRVTVFAVDTPSEEEGEGDNGEEDSQEMVTHSRPEWLAAQDIIALTARNAELIEELANARQRLEDSDVSWQRDVQQMQNTQRQVGIWSPHAFHIVCPIACHIVCI
jgi:hypothetical protein